PGARARREPPADPGTSPSPCWSHKRSTRPATAARPCHHLPCPPRLCQSRAPDRPPWPAREALMIVIAGSVAVRPDRREEAVRVARTMVAATRREAGCQTYRFSADLDDPNTFLIFEEWESEEALGRHFQTPHMAAFREALPGLLAGAPALRRYEIASATA